MIIGLTGFAQSGKDSVAKYLVEDHGYRRIAFADSIRDLLYEMDPFVDGDYHLKVLVDAYGWDIIKQKKEVRRMLQNLGVGARKVFGDNFWVARAMLKINGFQDKCVITDVRFTNEAEAIKQYDNAQIWRVKRPGVEAVNNHISETQMADYKVDQILSNQGTLEELRELVRTRVSL
jgi:cytidylate kinase